MSKKASKKRGKQGKKAQSPKSKPPKDSSDKGKVEPAVSLADDESAESDSSDTKESRETKASEKVVADEVPKGTPSNTPSSVQLIEKIDNGIGLMEQAFLMVALFSLIGVGTYQFVAGMLFNVNPTWPFEAIQYLVFAIAMWGAALSAQKGQMMSMDFISRKLPDKGRVILRIVTNLFVVFACYLLMRGGLIGVESVKGAHYELFPQSKAYLVLPIGAALIGIHYILHTVCDGLYLAAGLIPPEEEGPQAH